MPDEIEIELFRADPRASKGITAGDLGYIAGQFDGANPVPICIGHPKSNAPAHGEVAGFRAEGISLFGTLKGKFDKIVDGVKAGTILNRSMSFFHPSDPANPKPGKIWPRHLGFLGASPPGIPNMPRLDKALAFSAEADNLETLGDPAPAVIYDFDARPTAVLSVPLEKDPATMADPVTPTAAEVEAERETLRQDRLDFEAEQRTARSTANASVVDSLVAGGRVLPKDADRLKLVFDALAPEPLEFAAGEAKRSPASELAALLGGAVKLVPVNEPRTSPSKDFNAGDTPKDGAALARKARANCAADASLNFDAEVYRLSTEQEG